MHEIEIIEAARKHMTTALAASHIVGLLANGGRIQTSGTAA